MEHGKSDLSFGLFSVFCQKNQCNMVYLMQWFLYVVGIAKEARLGIS